MGSGQKTQKPLVPCTGKHWTQSMTAMLFSYSLVNKAGEEPVHSNNTLLQFHSASVLFTEAAKRRGGCHNIRSIKETLFSQIAVHALYYFSSLAALWMYVLILDHNTDTLVRAFIRETGLHESCGYKGLKQYCLCLLERRWRLT